MPVYTIMYDAQEGAARFKELTAQNDAQAIRLFRHEAKQASGGYPLKAPLWLVNSRGVPVYLAKVAEGHEVNGAPPRRFVKGSYPAWER